MTASEICNVLHSLVSGFYTGEYRKNPSIRKIFICNNTYWYIYFNLQSKVDYDFDPVDVTPEYITSKFQAEIAELVNLSQKTHCYTAIYQIDNGVVHEINIVFKQFLKEMDFITLDSEYETELKVITEKTKAMQKKYNDENWRKKIHLLIMSHPEGISLSNIVHKTRGIKQPEDRKQYLAELYRDNKIYLEIDTTLNKKKHVYKPKAD